jgi:hypothetical protein
VASLRIEPLPKVVGEPVALTVHLANVSSESIVIREKSSPTSILAARLLDSSGKPVPLTTQGLQLYSPPAEKTYYVGKSETLRVFQETTFNYRIGYTFDMHNSGVYQITVMAKIDSINSIACSNRLQLQFL